MKTKLNVAKIVLSLILVLALSMSLCLTVVFAEEAEPQTRQFNENYDRRLATASGDGTEPAYWAVSWNAGQCASTSDPIYKAGSPVFTAGFDSLAIELRSPDESVKLADLKIGMRTLADNSDAQATRDSYVLTDADVADGLSLSAGTDIGAEWVTLTIDFASTEMKIGDKKIDTTGIDNICGFHLYAADNTKAGKLDLRKVSAYKGLTETVVTKFESKLTNWWDGSESYTALPTSFVVADSRDFKSEADTVNNVDEAYSAIVLSIHGSGTVTVAPIGEDGTVGAAKAWSELKDLAGASVAALNGTHRNAVISLESLGARKIQGVQVAVTGGTAYVSEVFFTNLQDTVPDKYFPVLDTTNVAYLSKFDFEYLHPGKDYDKAVADCAGFGLDYALCYYSEDNAKITNGHLVLDGTGVDYTSLKVRSKTVSNGRPYMVIKYKLENGATLNDFRFELFDMDDIGHGVKYANQCLAGVALPSLSDANPYHSDNYSYLVVNLAETFGEVYAAGVEIFYTGAGQVLIDEIYFATPVLEWSEEALAADYAHEFSVAAAGYGYCGWVNGALTAGGADYMIVDIEGDISQLRIGMGGGTYWVTPNAEGTLKDIAGNTFNVGGAQVLVIDLVKSGVVGNITDIHFHNTFASAEDVLKINSVKFAKASVLYECGPEALAADFVHEITAAAAGYGYCGWINGSLGNGADLMILDIEGDISNFRIAMAGGEFWGTPNAAGTLKGTNGRCLPTSGAQTVVIDLAKSGVKGALGDIHLHNTFAAAGDVLKINSVKFAKYSVARTEGTEILADDFAGRNVTAAAEGYAYIGYIDGTKLQGHDLLVLEVEGDISQLRIGMGGGTYWVTPNAEGTLKDSNGKTFATSGKQTIVIDLKETGIAGEITEIHLHNTFAAVGDVLKITSAKAADILVGYEEIQLPVNDDTKPVITATTVPTSGKEGEEISLSAVASDNYGENVTITYEVTLGTKTIEVNNGKFTPSEAGTYTVKVIATDAAGNRAETVSQITVAEKEVEPASGLTDGAIAAIVIACVVVAAGAVVAVILVRKKKLGK